jgi:hypothetical protein
MMENTGFPTWTLWGMGLAALGALMAIGLAFLAQSPRWLTRLNLNGQRLDLRAKTFTGYGLALLLLAMGFFVAGVPLGADAPESVVAGVEPTGESDDQVTPTSETAEGGINGPTGQSGAMAGLATPESGGNSGAMTGLGQPTLDAGAIISGQATLALPPGATTGEPPAADATQEPAAEATEASPTPQPTITPTPTPSPTPTPTPIRVPTAIIGEGTSTLPVRQLPGGEVLVVVIRGDTVIPLPGHAYHSGDLWREIQTLDGIIGWVQDEFLDYGPQASGG